MCFSFPIHLKLLSRLSLSTPNEKNLQNPTDSLAPALSHGWWINPPSRSAKCHPSSRRPILQQWEQGCCLRVCSPRAPLHPVTSGRCSPAALPPTPGDQHPVGAPPGATPRRAKPCSEQHRPRLRGNTPTSPASLRASLSPELRASTSWRKAEVLQRGQAMAALKARLTRLGLSPERPRSHDLLEKASVQARTHRVPGPAPWSHLWDSRPLP